MEKKKKIDVAIKETKLRLAHVKEQIMLFSRERDVLQNQVDTLELIDQNKDLE